MFALIPSRFHVFQTVERSGLNESGDNFRVGRNFDNSRVVEKGKISEDLASREAKFFEAFMLNSKLRNSVVTFSDLFYDKEAAEVNDCC